MNNMFMGILFTIVFAVCLLFGVIARKYNTGHYDEMQELIRGKAYKYTCYSVLIFLAAHLYYDLILADAFFHVAASVVCITAIALGLSVFGLYSIFKGAYLYVNQKSNTMGAIFSGIALVNLITFALESGDVGNVVENNVMTFKSCYSQLFLGVVFALYAIAFIITSIRDKKEAGGLKNEES